MTYYRVVTKTDHKVIKEYDRYIDLLNDRDYILSHIYPENRCVAEERISGDK